MDKIKEFFVNLYDKFIALPWVRLAIDYCKEQPIWAGVIGGLVLLIVVVLCIMGGKRRRAKRRAKKVDEVAEETLFNEDAPVKTPVETPIETLDKTPSVEKPASPTIEKVASVEEVAPPAKEIAATENKPEPKNTEKTKAKTEKVKKAEKKEPPKTPSKKSDVSETLEMAENLVESDDPLQDHYDEDETDRLARYKGKWVICRVLTDDEDYEEAYFFELHASNGEKLLESEDYTTYQGAIRGIQTHKTNILNGNVKIGMTKKGDYIFKVLSGKNMLLCRGENYPTRARCQSAIDSTIRFAETAILDENVQDIVIKVPHEDDIPIAERADAREGKWLISTSINEEGQKIYYFELFASNGEKLLESEEYTTYIGAVNGIQTHKKNIDKGNFRISITKRGDYIYKLLNGNGQLLCLGEHYKNKRLCINAVESVKRFAMNSPVLTEEENAR